jgi:Cu2+-exporting ATPase
MLVLKKEQNMKEEKNNLGEKKMSGEKYACPMHCEEDKMYDQPGKCPICGMNLQKV